MKRKRKFQQQTGLWTRTVRDKGWWRRRLRKVRTGLITAQTKELVRNLYLSGEVSRCLPNKKTCQQEGNIPKFVIATTIIADAHSALLKKYPEGKIGLTSFIN